MLAGVWLAGLESCHQSLTCLLGGMNSVTGVWSQLGNVTIVRWWWNSSKIKHNISIHQGKDVYIQPRDFVKCSLEAGVLLKETYGCKTKVKFTTCSLLRDKAKIRCNWLKCGGKWRLALHTLVWAFFETGGWVWERTSSRQVNIQMATQRPHHLHVWRLSQLHRWRTSHIAANQTQYFRWKPSGFRVLNAKGKWK